MSQCFQCKMEIPSGGLVCPFCGSDPRSDLEKDITNAVSSGLSKAHSDKTGNIILQVIFFGLCIGALGFVFSSHGLLWMIGGGILGFINSKMMNRDK